MGRQLRKLAKIDGPTNAAKGAATKFLALADAGDGTDPAEFLDGMIQDASRSVSSPTIVDLFVSSDDRLYSESRKLVKVLSRNPMIDCRLSLADYPRHAEIRAPFAAHMIASLPELRSS
jgi:hypothetical protein